MDTVTLKWAKRSWRSAMASINLLQIYGKIGDEKEVLQPVAIVSPSALSVVCFVLQIAA